MRRINIIVAVLIWSVLLVSPTDTRAQAKFDDFVLSNDGRIVAVSAGGTIALFDWRAGKLTAMPLPAGIRSMGGPSFSTDGKSLAAAVSSDTGNIAIFDLATLQMTALHKSNCWLQSPPVFQPGDGAVLFSTGSFPVYLCLYDFGRRITSIVLQPENGFYAILSPVFVGQDTALFVGVGPRNPTVVAAVEKLGAWKRSAFVPYRLRLSGVPEIAYPDLVKREAALTAGAGSGPTSFAASRNGERIVFIDRSLTEEERVKRERTGPFRYDLFVIEKGIVRQVTHLETYLARQAVSYDGSTAAFGTYVKPVTGFTYEPAAARIFDLSIVDLQTGAVTKTDLLERLNADPRFHRKDK